jgi:predicted aspartyl protease
MMASLASYRNLSGKTPIRIALAIAANPATFPTFDGVEPRTGEGRREVEFVLDSGADLTLIQRDVIDAVGLEATGEKIPLEGVISGVVWADVYYAYIAIGGQNIKIRCAVFPLDSRITDENLLSISELLEHFDILLSCGQVLIFRRSPISDQSGRWVDESI